MNEGIAELYSPHFVGTHGSCVLIRFEGRMSHASLQRGYFNRKN